MPKPPRSSGDIARAWTAPGRGRIFDRQRAVRAGIETVGTLVELAHLERLDRGGRWLEVGAGTGRTCLPVADRTAGRVVALDASFEMIAALADKDRPANLDLVVGVALAELPFATECFDLVMTFGVVGHYPDWQAVLRPVARVLKPGGYLVFNHRNADAIRSFRQTPPRRKGLFEPDRLAADLAALGLELAAIFPTRFTINPLSKLWGLGRSETEDPLLRRRFNALTDAILEAEGAARAWALWEMRLGQVLPAASSVRALIVAQRPGASSGTLPFPAAERDPEAVTAAVQALATDPELAAAANHPAVGAMLSLLDPLLSRFTGRPDLWTGLIPDYEIRRAEVAAAVDRLCRISPLVRASDWTARARAQGRRATEALRLRLARFMARG